MTYRVFLKDDQYYVGWIGEGFRCSKYGPFKTEEEAIKAAEWHNTNQKLFKDKEFDDKKKEAI